jgi:hypothetical protein
MRAYPFHSPPKVPPVLPSDFPYALPVTIKNTSTSALTDYQVKVTVPYKRGLMRPDFGDIRFANRFGKSLPYWVESKTDGASATVWVKADSIPASSETKIYCLCGNPSTVRADNITNTMIFGDDFSGDLSKWSGDTSYFTVSGGELQNTPTTTVRKIYADAGPLVNTVLAARIKTTDASTDLMWGIGYRIDASNRAYFCRRDEDLGGHYRRWGDGTNYYSNVPPQWTSGEYGVDQVIIKTTVASSVHSFNGTTVTGVVNFGTDIPTNVIIQAYGAGTPGVQYMDWIYVRKYTDPEPTTSVGVPMDTRRLW